MVKIGMMLNREKSLFFICKKKSKKEVFLIFMTYYNNMRDIKIKNIIKEERPRERFIKYGVENLSNEELLFLSRITQ